jgi:hypothetical protein
MCRGPACTVDLTAGLTCRIEDDGGAAYCFCRYSPADSASVLRCLATGSGTGVRHVLVDHLTVYSPHRFATHSLGGDASMLVLLEEPCSSGESCVRTLTIRLGLLQRVEDIWMVVLGQTSLSMRMLESVGI